LIRTLRVLDERWPTAHVFTIARGAKTEAHVLVVEISQAGVTGRGEAVPYARYGETVEGAMDTVERLRQIGRASCRERVS
jgi:L-alanine-DL-glutamate epimerase-like enolase superfamily enzyme